MNRSIKITYLTILMMSSALQAMQPDRRGNALDQQIRNAIAEDDVDRVRDLILLYAIHLNDHRRAKDFILEGADVNARDGLDNNETPLMYAVHANNNGLCKLLIESGADLDLKNSVGNTALMMAGNASINRLLIESGANVNLQNSVGYTALINAVRNFTVHKLTSNMQLKICLQLINAHANLDLQDNVQGRTAIMMAILHDEYEIAKVLIEAGANLEVRDNDKNNALIDSIAYAQPDAQDALTDLVSAILNRLAQLTRAEKNSVKEWLSQVRKMKATKGIDMPKDIRILVAQDIIHLLAQNVRERIISADANKALEFAKRYKKRGAAQMLEQYLDIRFLETLVQQQTGFPKLLKANEKAKINNNRDVRE